MDVLAIGVLDPFLVISGHGPLCDVVGMSLGVLMRFELARVVPLRLDKVRLVVLVDDALLLDNKNIV